MYLIDTNILIYHFNNDIPEKSILKLRNIFLNHFNISVITKMEFLGFKKHTEDSYQKSIFFLKHSTMFDINNSITDIVIDIRRKYNIKLPDAIISATAINHNLTLVTRNEKDFKDINIKIYNPFE